MALTGTLFLLGAVLSPPDWEAGGQLSFVTAGGERVFRVQLGAGKLWGPHEVEGHAAMSRMLTVTVADVDIGYALHYVAGAWMPFARVAAGARFERVGGGGRRARYSVVGAVGLKVRASSVWALRVDLEYRHLGGAPGVADELAVLVGPSALW